jgi:hypothetical protein
VHYHISSPNDTFLTLGILGYLSEILTVLYFTFREKEPELLRSGELLMREFEE